jgi:hypothetical protein
MPAKENTVVAAIKKHCEVLRRQGLAIKAIKFHGNAFTEAGTPDLHVTINGRSFWIECKRSEREKPTEIQVRRLKEWEDAGAIVSVCRSLGDFKELLASHGISVPTPRPLEAPGVSDPR